jgi:transposase
MHVVQLYLTTEVSYEDLAIQTGVKDAAIIARWVRDYRVAGIEALRPKPKGRRRNVDKKKISKELAKELPDEKAEYLKQLEDENLRLRIENAFLKELRRLRLEEEAQRTQRELQAVSEENSD